MPLVALGLVRGLEAEDWCKAETDSFARLSAAWKRASRGRRSTGNVSRVCKTQVPPCVYGCARHESRDRMQRNAATRATSRPRGTHESIAASRKRSL
jgi:hypothetical protein